MGRGLSRPKAPFVRGLNDCSCTLGLRTSAGRKIDSFLIEADPDAAKGATRENSIRVRFKQMLMRAKAAAIDQYLIFRKFPRHCYSHRVRRSLPSIPYWFRAFPILIYTEAFQTQTWPLVKVNDGAVVARGGGKWEVKYYRRMAAAGEGERSVR